MFHNYYDTNLSHNTKLESFFKWIGKNKIQYWVAVGNRSIFLKQDGVKFDLPLPGKRK